MNIKNGMESETTGMPSMEFLETKKEEKQTDISAVDNQKIDYKGKSLMMTSSPHQLWNSNCENKKQKTFIDFIKVSTQCSKNLHLALPRR